MRLKTIALLLLTLAATIIEAAPTITNSETPANGTTTQQMHGLWRRGGDGADMFWSASGEIGVVQAWPGKIVMITPDGEPGATYALPYRQGGGYQSVVRGKGHDGNVILTGTAWTREDGKQTQYTDLNAYDAEGTEVPHYTETAQEMHFGEYEFQAANYTDFKSRWDVADDGRVAAALSFDKYEITIWNADGTVDRVIERPDYQPVMRTAAEKARFQTMYEAFTRWNRGSTFKVSDHHQTIGQLFFRPDGTLWVQSSAYRWRAPAGIYTSFDVYDTVGHYLQRVDLIADADASQDGFFSPATALLL